MTSSQGVYRVDHLAIKTEYVVAESEDEALDSAAGGWSCGDFAYADADHPTRLCSVLDLAELDGVGGTTIQRLLDADGPVPLGPASTALGKRDVTRLRRRLNNQRRKLE